MLDKSIKLNQLHNVMLIKKSVGNIKGKILYNLSTVPMLSGMTIPAGKVHSTIETESIDLDTALTIENRVYWLIIDVESFEVNVLNGARNMLRKYSPKIIIEIGPDNVYKVKEILKNEEYSITPLYNFYYYFYKAI